MKRRHLALWLVVSFIFSTPASSHAMETTLSHKWVCRPMEQEFYSPSSISSTDGKASDSTIAKTSTTKRSAKRTIVTRQHNRTMSRPAISTRSRAGHTRASVAVRRPVTNSKFNLRQDSRPGLKRQASRKQVHLTKIVGIRGHNARHQLVSKAKFPTQTNSRLMQNRSQHRKEVRLTKALDRRAKKHMRQIRSALRYREVSQTSSVTDHLAIHAGLTPDEATPVKYASANNWSKHLVRLHQQELAHAELHQPRLKAAKKTRRAAKATKSLLAIRTKSSQAQLANFPAATQSPPIIGPVTQFQDSTAHRAINTVQHLGQSDSSLTPENSPLAHGPLNDSRFTTLPLPDSVKIGKTYKDGYAWLKVFSQRQAIATQKALLTGYNSDARQTDSDPWITAKGYLCGIGVAACNGLPFGTVFRVIGNPELEGRVLINLDRKAKRYAGHWVDVWVENAAKAFRVTTPRGQFQEIEILATAAETKPFLDRMTRSYTVDQATLKSWTLQ